MYLAIDRIRFTILPVLGKVKIDFGNIMQKLNVKPFSRSAGLVIKTVNNFLTINELYNTGT